MSKNTAQLYAEKNRALIQAAAERQQKLNTRAQARSHYAAALLHRLDLAPAELLRVADTYAAADLALRDADLAAQEAELKKEQAPKA